MTVTFKNKVEKKNKTKMTKNKVLGLKKNKEMKNNEIKDKDSNRKVKKMKEEQAMAMKKIKIASNKKKKDLQNEEERKVNKQALFIKKKQTEGKKKKKDTHPEEDMVVEERRLAESDSECEQEEMVTEEEESGTSDDDEENYDDDPSDDKARQNLEKDDDEGYEESCAKDVSNRSPHAAEKSKQNKHVVFDDDETFENLPAFTSNVATESPEENEEDSDSDAPPEEETISMGKDIFEDDNKKMKNELIKLKNQVKEARRLKHEKNREQQLKKRKRLQNLEESRLPTDLLNAVAMEKKEPQKFNIAKEKGKRKTFEDHPDEKLLKETVTDDDDILSLTQGVKVRAVQQEAKKHASIASIAAEFRQKAIYNKSPRMSSLDQRQMRTKQKKSGKDALPVIQKSGKDVFHVTQKKSETDVLHIIQKKSGKNAFIS